MSHRIWMLCVLGGSLAWGQANPAATAASKPRGEDDDQKSSIAIPVATVAMDAPVLTLKGFCPGRPAPSVGVGAVCQTVITRAQFEKIAAAIRPNMTASVKQQLASLYPRLLVMSQTAEELGLDKQAPYDQMIDFSRMQILTQGLTHTLQQESARISDQEIADYYQKHLEVFEEYSLERLFVPLHKQPAGSNGADTQRDPAVSAQPELTSAEEGARSGGSEPELKDLAEKLRARAAAGEDFVKLQQQAFEAAGVKVASPRTRMEKMRRAALPAAHAALFDLKVGEVSPVVSDTSGYYIYKLDAKDRLTVEQAKGEIRHTLESQRVKESLDKIQGLYTTETNEAYFGSSRSEQ